jgi:hypothetical protein
VLVRESVRVSELERAYTDVKRSEEEAMRRAHSISLQLDASKRELAALKVQEGRCREVCMRACVRVYGYACLCACVWICVLVCLCVDVHWYVCVCFGIGVCEKASG